MCMISLGCTEYTPVECYELGIQDLGTWVIALQLYMRKPYGMSRVFHSAVSLGVRITHLVELHNFQHVRVLYHVVEASSSSRWNSFTVRGKMCDILNSWNSGVAQSTQKSIEAGGNFCNFQSFDQFLCLYKSKILPNSYQVDSVAYWIILVSCTSEFAGPILGGAFEQIIFWRRFW